MRHSANKPASRVLGIFPPRRYAVFRRIWTASLLSMRANEFHMGPEPIRMLERPIGSVRWKEDTPDRSTGDVAPIASPGSAAERSRRISAFALYECDKWPTATAVR
jgi:hypothetical protein